VKARIHVTLKNGVLDPQGKAIETALHGLGFSEAGNVRQGKVIELDLKGISDKAAAEARVKEMCAKLLSNPVIEDYSVELAG
jgi:phosphoribosylformylglycinamidine synthase subunit PurS